jgi:hypothetical protein
VIFEVATPLDEQPPVRDFQGIARPAKRRLEAIKCRASPLDSAIQPIGKIEGQPEEERLRVICSNRGSERSGRQLPMPSSIVYQATGYVFDKNSHTFYDCLCSRVRRASLKPIEVRRKPDTQIHAPPKAWVGPAGTQASGPERAVRFSAGMTAGAK